MASMRRPATRSALSSVVPERYDNLQQHFNEQHRGFKKVALLAIHRAARRPKLISRYFGLGYRDAELPQLGQGFVSNVFRLNNQEVLKVDDASALLLPHQQQELAKRRQVQHDRMARQLGPFVLAEEHGVGPHPYFANVPVVQARQAFAEGEDPGLFTPERVPSADEMTENLARYTASGGSSDALADFVERSQAFFKRESLLPDTNGEHNFARAGAGLSIIDGQPIGGEHPRVQRLITGHLAVLEQTLAA